MARVRLAAGEPSILHADLAGAVLDHRAIHQAALDGDALALDVHRTVQLNHAFGISNLVRIFDPQLVVIGWASVALSDAYHTRMRALGAKLDLPAAVSQQMAQRGVAPPAIVHAAHGSEAFRLGAAALLVDELLQTPPGVEA